MSRYAYTATNLLNEPYHYMYTPFEGPIFLAAYLEDRRDARSQLSASLVDASESGAPECEDRPAPTPGLPDDRTVRSLDLLGQLLDARRNHRPEMTLEDTFLRKFEVSKRIYTAYDSHMKRASTDASDLEIYAACAALFALRTSQTNDIRALNVLLKLTDLLLSAGAKGSSRTVRRHTLNAIDAELAAVGSLMAGGGGQVG